MPVAPVAASAVRIPMVVSGDTIQSHLFNSWVPSTIVSILKILIGRGQVKVSEVATLGPVAAVITRLSHI